MGGKPGGACQLNGRTGWQTGSWEGRQAGLTVGDGKGYDAGSAW